MLSGFQGRPQFTPESACAYLNVCFEIDEQLRAKKSQSAPARASEISAQELLKTGAVGSLGSPMPLASHSKVQASGLAQHPNSWVNTAHIPATSEPLQNSVDWQKTLQENISTCTDDILREERQSGRLLFKNMREIAQKSTTSKLFLDNLQVLLVMLEKVWMGKNSAGHNQEKVCENLMSFLHSPIIKGWVKSAFVQQNHKEKSLISSITDQSSQLPALELPKDKQKSALYYSNLLSRTDSGFCNADSSNSILNSSGVVPPPNHIRLVPAGLIEHETSSSSSFGKQTSVLENSVMSNSLGVSLDQTNANKRKRQLDPTVERQVRRHLSALPDINPFNPQAFSETEGLMENQLLPSSPSTLFSDLERDLF